MGAQLVWEGVVAVLAPIIAAALVLAGVLATIRQKERTDSKEQWWKRVQWSAELVLETDEHQRALGLAALTALIERADKIQDSDADLLAAIINQVDISNQQSRGREQGHDHDTATDGGPDPRGAGTAGARPENEQDVA